MKKIMKLAGCLFLAAVMTLGIGFMVQAAVCGCGESDEEHRNWHQIDYLYYDEAGHTRHCSTCFNAGHDQFCSNVRWNEKHTFFTDGDKRRCECGYVCKHPNVEWTSDGDRCLKICQDCNKEIISKAHTWDYKQITASGSKNHQQICRDCGYKKGTGLTQHTFTYKYTQLAQQEDPRKTTSINSTQISASTSHTVKLTCSDCGYTENRSEEHTFAGDTCSRCKLTKEIIGKVRKLKGKQAGKGKHAKKKAEAQWIWDGKRSTWRNAGIWNTYTYKVKISCKKQKNAFGYIASVDKKTIVSGMSIHKTANGNYSIFTKTNMILPVSSSRKLKNVTIYVAPVSKNGFIGKVSKVKVKLK